MEINKEELLQVALKAVFEAKKIMSSKYYHFKTGGEDIWSPDTSTTDFVMNNLTM